MNDTERGIYKSCLQRYSLQGTAPLSDVEIILMMEREINQYRERIQRMETEIADLRTENYNLKLDNTLLKVEKYSDVIEKPKLGKTVEFEFNGKSHKMMVTKVTEEIGGTVILEGEWVKWVK